MGQSSRECDSVYVWHTDTINASIKTNTLQGLLFIPNIGLEFYLGRQWSVAANWMYAWWKIEKHHLYWRTYGGDFEVRRWFGGESKEKPLTGYHLGLYVQLLTYDFMLNQQHGYLGDRWSYGVGVACGYSFPVDQRFNLDFTVGGGYFTGEYKEYLCRDDCYLWQATKRHRRLGLTKVEISLVWLIGFGNYNSKKGGSQ
ncbi:MAG: DUF3575 domain-containing protein [Bacteroidales bacterium]|jgi:hypothetical protein|nr:DUF3575 domain-containing protein [Bacteroidales bacterium]MDD2830921.1 DUF3575 domain-containing protein [Bacteroidales bacterium]MDD3208271.1 DUF3575 domain-containing protein [Bacteroidales bacterium]MDD3696687.1 DUF3575 domain-containing protein [Bacteroidales bacterium]MDD4166988.1 DUF3575 domain-containing protein [Bacteroidales bacterium]